MLYLDIGTGRYPAILNGLQLEDGDRYVGLDSGFLPDDPWHSRFDFSAALSYLEKARQRTRDSRAVFLAASGTALPFREETFGRVLLGNVLGSNISDENRHRLVHEAARVLERTGRLVISETVSPFPYEQLSETLVPESLVVEATYRPGHEHYAILAKQYGLNHTQLSLAPELIAQYPFLNTDYIAICSKG